MSSNLKVEFYYLHTSQCKKIIFPTAFSYTPIPLPRSNHRVGTDQGMGRTERNGNGSEKNGIECNRL
jgi:hypothetical protein